MSDYLLVKVSPDAGHISASLWLLFMEKNSNPSHGKYILFFI